jgi:hypothetical protein
MRPTPQEFAAKLYESALEHHKGDVTLAYTGCMNSVVRVLNAIRPDDKAFEYFEEVKKEYETNYSLKEKND